MKAVFGHHSALDCWQMHGQHKALAYMQPSVCDQVAYTIPSELLLQEASAMFELNNLPLHLLVPNADSRRNCSQVTCHVCHTPLPRGSLCSINEHYLAASPELCFVQMANHLPLLKLIELGFELCGTYQPPLHENDPLGKRSQPLSTPEKLRAYAGLIKGEHGSKKALAALQWVVPGSASPMETFLWMRLCLPPRLGGRGFPAASLNSPIQLDAKGRALAGVPALRGDLFFEEHGVVVEYDSKEHHSDAESVANDSVRRGIFECQGIKVVTLTRREFFTFKEFEGKVRQVSKLIGLRLRTPTQKQIEQRTRMRTIMMLDYKLMSYRPRTERQESFRA